MSGAEEDIEDALAELRLALESLRRAQALWTGQRPWIGAKTWDVAGAARALDEAGENVRRARAALERVLARARAPVADAGSTD